MEPADIRVLVIDDEDAVRKLLCHFLEDSGFAVTAARSGEEALELVTAHPFHAAIVDIRLPDMDGDEFIRRAHAVRPGIRYLIHTGSLEYSITEELAAIGISEEHIIYKPVRDMRSISSIIVQTLKGVSRERPGGDS